MAMVWSLAGVAFVVLVLTTITNWLTRARLARSAETALAGLRRQVFDHIHRCRSPVTPRAAAACSSPGSPPTSSSSRSSSRGAASPGSSASSMMTAVAVTMVVYDWRLAVDRHRLRGAAVPAS